MSVQIPSSKKSVHSTKCELSGGGEIVVGGVQKPLENRGGIQFRTRHLQLRSPRNFAKIKLAVSFGQSSNLFRRKSSLKWYPHPYPRGGDTTKIQTVLCLHFICRGLTASPHPRLRSVLWLARLGRKRRPCSPKTSLIAHAKTSSATDGLKSNQTFLL